jgi:hypothetical protein
VDKFREKVEGACKLTRKMRNLTNKMKNLKGVLECGHKKPV